MPFLFILVLIFGLTTILAFFASFLFKSKKAGAVAGIGVVVTVITAIFSSLTMVPTREVGVELSFNRPTGVSLDNGIHWKTPWHKVVDMDGTTQTQFNTGEKRTEIRLGNQATAYVQNTLRWSINTDGADELYVDYRKFETIESSLVTPELAAALNAAFAAYDPLANAGEDQSYDQISEDVKKRLQERVGDRIIIQSLIIPKVDFDDGTQSRIDALQKEIGNTRIAEQSRKTAEQTKLKNDLLARSVTPDINQANCLEIAKEKGADLPPAFNCFGGGNTLVGPKQ